METLPMSHEKLDIKPREKLSNAQRNCMEFAFDLANKFFPEEPIKTPPDELTGKKAISKFYRDQYRTQYNQHKEEIREWIAYSDLEGILDITRLSQADIAGFLQSQNITNQMPQYERYRDFITRAVRTADRSINFRAMARYANDRIARYPQTTEDLTYTTQGKDGKPITKELKGASRLARAAKMIREIEYPANAIQVGEGKFQPESARLSYAEIIIKEIGTRTEALAYENNRNLDLIISQDIPDPIIRQSSIGKIKSAFHQVREKMADMLRPSPEQIARQEAKKARKNTALQRQAEIGKGRRKVLAGIAGVAAGYIANWLFNKFHVGLDAAKIASDTFTKAETAKNLSPQVLSQIGSEILPTATPPPVLQPAPEPTAIPDMLSSVANPAALPIEPVINSGTVPSVPDIEPTTVPEIKKGIMESAYQVILGNRDKRARSDPEYTRRVDADLNNGRINILLAGLDQKSEGVQRSDAMLILSYDIHTGKASVFSIPRNLHVPEIRDLTDKLYGDSNPYKQNSFSINAIPVFGEDMDMRTIVENATSLSMDGAFVWDWDGFQNIVDIFGGVDINIDQNFINLYNERFYGQYQKNLELGTNRFNGSEALWYARVRKLDTTYDRENRQIIVAKNLAKKMLHMLENDPAQLIDVLSGFVSGQHEGFRMSTEVDFLDFAGLIPSLVRDRQQLREVVDMDMVKISPQWLDPDYIDLGPEHCGICRIPEGTSQMWPKRWANLFFEPDDRLEYWTDLRGRIKYQFETSRKMELVEPEPLPDTPKIMLLGDSLISLGSIPEILFRTLAEKNKQAQFVGDVSSKAGIAHEGHGGFTTIKMVNELYAENKSWKWGEVETPKNFSQHIPDIVLIQLGTNDAASEFNPDLITIADYRYIINFLREKNPNVRIILSKMIPSKIPEVDIRLQELNRKIDEFVVEQNTRVSPVVTTEDLRPVWTAGDFADNYHPNSSGQEKMAQAYFQVLSQFWSA